MEMTNIRYATVLLDPFIRELDICPRGLLTRTKSTRYLSGGIGPHTQGIWHHAPAFSTPFIREPDICPKTNISGQIVRTQGAADKALGASHGQFGQYEATQTGHH